ncbi:hypothetical protein E2C01_020031 [Portunus trituberculatus]|uniref:Uncharacterized protein n=1 Tax=Portunus trituberculatus TaxID=210409 RepID=A0A5B7DZ47_PORTR|nr:hypothetical protein [Portunus trituberculatus]
MTTKQRPGGSHGGAEVKLARCTACLAWPCRGALHHGQARRRVRDPACCVACQEMISHERDAAQDLGNI